MLIEIHLLQNHSPSNPNRDDLGAPKTAWFGATLRGRISSQCLKRSIRVWPEFRDALKGLLGERTKLFPYLVGAQLKKSSITDENERLAIVKACKSIARAEGAEGKTERGKKADPRDKTPQLVFLQPGHVDEFVSRLERLRQEKKEGYAFFCNPIVIFKQQVSDRLAELGVDEDEVKSVVDRAPLIAKLRQGTLFKDDEQKPEGWDADNPDPIHVANQLFELSQSADEKRFKELLKKQTATEKQQMQDAAPEAPKEFKKFQEELYAPLQLNAVDIALFGRMTTSDAFEDVEAAVEVAHAISTNELRQEVDYFTAMDDRGLPGAGAGHVGENQFNSCTYYKYFSIDWDALIDRLVGPDPDQQRRLETAKLAARTIKAFIEAAWFAVPSGKKKGHAHNNSPSAILVEVKERHIPTNYANAFVKPAEQSREHDLIEDSIAKFGQYIGCTARSNGVAVKSRIWHAVRGEALEYVECQGRSAQTSDAKRPQPVPASAALSLPDFVNQTLVAIGFDPKEFEAEATK